MSTEVWFRNPHDYIRELVETGQHWVAWDRGMLAKKKIDPNKHAELYFGLSVPYRLLAIGEQGAAELGPANTLKNPKAVYPVWEYGSDMSLLENLLAHPAGEDKDVCSTPGIPADELPVLGQEHRVIVVGNPSGHLSTGRAFLRQLKELQEDYPEAIIHLHGSYTWSIAFGTSLRSADVEPRITASKGRVILPSGQEVEYEKTYRKTQWVNVLGFDPYDLKIPRNRCMFNIKSAVWAGSHYTELFKFRVGKRYAGDTDVESADAEFKALETKSHLSVKSKAKDGDLFSCNTCSLQNECKYFREGAVCSVPNSDPKQLTEYFGTRDSGQIIDGLAILMKSGIRRYERGLSEESITDELLPEVTKIQHELFDQGVKLAKLIDPSLRTGAGVQVNVGGNSAVQVNGGNPRTVITRIIRDLEESGIARDDITPEMIDGVMAGMASAQAAAAGRRAIEGTVIENGG